MIRFACYFFLIIFSITAFAMEDYFSYKNWGMVCDNTLTCRAYSYIDDENSAIFLKRYAGANQPIIGSVYLEDPSIYEQITLSINDKPTGIIEPQDEQPYSLTEQQTLAIIEAMKKNDSTVTFYNSQQTWNLSDEGFNAVMLKMDELQGRVGTIGAVIRSGSKDESNVYPPNSYQIIYKSPVITPEQSRNITFNEIITLFPEFKKRYENSEDGINCNEYMQSNDLDISFEEGDYPLPRLIKLDSYYHLLEVFCVYDMDSPNFAYWVIPNAINPIDSNIQLVTKKGTSYENGTIDSSIIENQNNCAINQTWTWSKNQFILSFSGINPPCNRTKVDPAWYLATWVTAIK